MTPDEVQRVLARPASPADLAKVCGEKCEEGAALDLDDYELNGQRFIARLWFTKSDLRLQAVSLYAKQLDDTNGNAVFSKMKSFLETSYGPPKSTSMIRGDFVISWTQPTTTITLYSNATNNLRIVYEQRADHEDGKS